MPLPTDTSGIGSLIVGLVFFVLAPILQVIARLRWRKQ